MLKHLYQDAHHGDWEKPFPLDATSSSVRDIRTRGHRGAKRGDSRAGGSAQPGRIKPDAKLSAPLQRGTSTTSPFIEPYPAGRNSRTTNMLLSNAIKHHIAALLIGQGRQREASNRSSRNQHRLRAPFVRDSEYSSRLRREDELENCSCLTLTFCECCCAIGRKTRLPITCVAKHHGLSFYSQRSRGETSHARTH